MARAEFVLGRHERHRTAMNELLQRLKDEGNAFETALGSEREAMEKAIGALGGQAENFEQLSSEAERGIEQMMANAAARATQLTASFAREADRLKEISDAAAASLSRIVDSLHDAGAGAQALIGETALGSQDQCQGAGRRSDGRMRAPAAGLRQSRRPKPTRSSRRSPRRSRRSNVIF